MFLDKYSSSLLIRRLYPGYALKALKKDELSDNEIFWICRVGSQTEQEIMLNKFDLEYAYLTYLIFWADGKIKELAMKKLSKKYYGRK